jgi:LmbE family N-acetylglucosaminyl deacetylase
LVYALAISPHTDDAELGCGGTLHKLSREADVTIVSLSAPDPRLAEEFVRSAEVLKVKAILHEYPRRRFLSKRQEILDTLIGIRKELEPELVFCPSEMDGHQDHIVVYRETLRAFKYDHSIYTYEAPWNQFRSEITAFSMLDDRDLQAKLKALECYESQQNHHYFFPTFTESLARVRGAQVNSKYAEAFGVVRSFIGRFRD